MIGKALLNFQCHRSRRAGVLGNRANESKSTSHFASKSDSSSSHMLAANMNNKSDINWNRDALMCWLTAPGAPSVGRPGPRQGAFETLAPERPWPGPGKSTVSFVQGGNGTLGHWCPATKTLGLRRDCLLFLPQQHSCSYDTILFSFHFTLFSRLFFLISFPSHFNQHFSTHTTFIFLLSFPPPHDNSLIRSTHLSHHTTKPTIVSAPQKQQCCCDPSLLRPA